MGLEFVFTPTGELAVSLAPLPSFFNDSVQLPGTAFLFIFLGKYFPLQTITWAPKSGFPLKMRFFLGSLLTCRGGGGGGYEATFRLVARACGDAPHLGLAVRWTLALTSELILVEKDPFLVLTRFVGKATIFFTRNSSLILVW